MRVTARRIPRAKGLAGVCQGPRGFTIHVDGQQVGSVNALRLSGSAWYFYAGDRELGIERINTCNDTPYPTVEEAKAAALAYVKEALKGHTAKEAKTHA